MAEALGSVHPGDSSYNNTKSWMRRNNRHRRNYHGGSLEEEEEELDTTSFIQRRYAYDIDQDDQQSPFTTHNACKFDK